MHRKNLENLLAYVSIRNIVHNLDEEKYIYIYIFLLPSSMEYFAGCSNS